jgi:hypothetical protein
MPWSRRRFDEPIQRKFYGQSGKVYFVTWSEETHWHAFIENAQGFVSHVAKTAAIDCGAVDDPKGSVFGSKELNTPSTLAADLEKAFQVYG